MGGLYAPRLRATLTDLLGAPVAAALEGVFTATERQLADLGGGVSHGYLVWHLAVGLGWRPADATRLGLLLEALQVAIDLADNLADEAKDRATPGRPAYQDFYRGVPRETLMCLPALLVGAVVQGLHEQLPAPRFAPARAAREVLATLAAMSVGQGLPDGDPLRVDAIAGQEGRLLCLPLWLMPAPTPEDEARTRAVERWAVTWARTWQLHIDVREAPGDAGARERLRDGITRCRGCWPSFPPFTTGPFAAERVLPGQPPGE